MIPLERAKIISAISENLFQIDNKKFDKEVPHLRTLQPHLLDLKRYDADTINATLSSLIQTLGSSTTLKPTQQQSAPCTKETLRYCNYGAKK